MLVRTQLVLVSSQFTCRRRQKPLHLQHSSAELVKPVFSTISSDHGLFKPGLSKDTDSAWGRDLTKHTTSKQTHDWECRHYSKQDTSLSLRAGNFWHISWHKCPAQLAVDVFFALKHNLSQLLRLSMPCFMRTYFQGSVPLSYSPSEVLILTILYYIVVNLYKTYKVLDNCQTWEILGFRILFWNT